LCIDSDIRAGQYLKNLCQPAGNSITTAWSYRQGLRELRQNRFALTITRETVRLPGDGRRLARALAARRNCATLVLEQDLLSIPAGELLSAIHGLIRSPFGPEPEPEPEAALEMAEQFA
jgi:hypothetical protein